MKEKILWCCVGPRGTYDYTSIARLKSTSVLAFLEKAGGKYWDYYTSQGWKCIKVTVTIEPAP